MENEFELPENRHHFDLFYKFICRPSKGLSLCQVMPEERLKILSFFENDPLRDRIQFIDMVESQCRTMKLQQIIIDVYEKSGTKKNIFFIYNLESCLSPSQTDAIDFFQGLNLIRDFFMQFEASFVFFVTESSVKKMIQNAFDFYDWMKFTFTFISESKDLWLQAIEIGEGEEFKFSNPLKKIEYLKNSIKDIENEKDKSLHLLELGALYRQVGQYDDALEQVIKSLDIEEKYGDPDSMAQRYNVIGLIYGSKNEPDKALKFFSKTSEIFEKNNNLKELAITNDHIARVYHNMGHRDRAIEFLQKSLELKEKLRDRRGLAQTWGNMGNVYQSKGDRDRAIEFYRKSLEVFEILGDRHSLALAWGNMGLVYKDKGDWDRAIEFLQKSLELKEKLRDRHGLAQTWGNLGLVYWSKGHRNRAIEFFHRSLDVFEELGDRHGLAQTWGNLGRALFEKGEHKQGIRLVDKAVKVLHQVGDRPGEETCRAIMAKFTKRLGQELFEMLLKQIHEETKKGSSEL
jgi:tetratricopeptide (TPR) repeat protein